MKHICIVPILFICIAAFPLAAQNADRMTEILTAEKITYAQASYFPAVWLDISNEQLKPEQTAQYLADKNILKTVLSDSAALQQPARLEHLAFICMKAWSIKGGMMYSLTHAPRYAFRELQAAGILKPADDPSAFVDGQRAMNIMYACMELSGTEDN